MYPGVASGQSGLTTGTKYYVQMDGTLKATADDISQVAGVAQSNNNQSPILLNKIMITLIRPILFAFLQSEQVKRLIVDLLTKLAESTDNEVDDAAVAFIKNGLFPSK